MATVQSSKNGAHFPAIPNPSTAENNPVSGGAAGAVIGGVGINPQPNALAGCYGTLTINGVSIVSNGGTSGPYLDLTKWGNKELVNAINALVPGVTASIKAPPNLLVLQSPAGVPITIGGSANVLAALGLTAGSTNN